MKLSKEQIFYPLLTEITALTGYDLTDLSKAATRSETNVRDCFIYLLSRYMNVPPGTFAQEINLTKHGAYQAARRAKNNSTNYSISNIIKAGEVVYLRTCIEIKRKEIRELNKQINKIK